MERLEPELEPEEAGFAGTRTSDQGDVLPRRDVEVEPLENRLTVARQPPFDVNGNRAAGHR